MKYSRDVERFASEHGRDPSTVSAREARAYTAQIAWNQTMRRLATQAPVPLPRPTDFVAELAAGRARFVTPSPKGGNTSVVENTWANEIWRLYKHPPNLYAKFWQAMERNNRRTRQ